MLLKVVPKRSREIDTTPEVSDDYDCKESGLVDE
jgi:hypothetical protein